MSSDELMIPGQDPSGPVVPGSQGGELAPPPPPPPPPLPPSEPEEPGLDIQRLIAGLLRYKWIVVLAGILGAGAGALVYKTIQPEYTAAGTLWLQQQPSGREGGGAGGALAPIRQAGLFEEEGWLELLKSYAVLDPVVLEKRLYLRYPPEHAPLFADFAVDSTFAPGVFRYTVAEDGSGYSLQTSQGILVESGAPGDSVGTDLGFQWVPSVAALAPGMEVEFTIVSPRDASEWLSDQIQARLDQVGSFIRLSYSGTDPEHIADVLNAVMNRHVEVAAQLTSQKFTDELEIMVGQLARSDSLLSAAELELENFRVQTITLPSGESGPVTPGLAATRDPVFEAFFEMRMQLEDRTQEAQRLREFLANRGDSALRIEALEIIPAVAEASELSATLEELVQRRAELSVARETYSDEYPPVQSLLRRIRTIEHLTIPALVTSLAEELEADASILQARVDSAAAELEEIPPRTIQEARLERRVSNEEGINTDLERRLSNARLAEASSTPYVQVLDEAVVPVIPSSDQRIRMAAIAFIGLIGASVGLAILLDRVDSRVRYPTQVSSGMGLDVLGSIPRILPPTGKQGQERAAQAIEAFRELRMRIGFAYGSAGPMIFTVSSPDQSEGKSLISTNLAVTFAEMGKRTLLLDADLRRGDAHKLLGTTREPGLADYLRNRDVGEIIQSTDYEHLHYIGSGSRFAGTPELLASPRMGSFMASIKRAYDVVIVDSPPLAAGADALVLGGLTGNMVVVVRTGSTQRNLAEAKLEVLSRLPVRVLGAVLNDIEPTSGVYRYYSSYLPDYTPTTEVEGDERQLAPVIGE